MVWKTTTPILKICVLWTGRTESVELFFYSNEKISLYSFHTVKKV